MPNDTASNIVPVAEKVRTAVLDFFRSLDREVEEINDETDLICATGASSLEGLDFVLDLEGVLGVTIPNEFNPFVHPSGKRGMKFRELVEFAEQFPAADKGGEHAG